MLCYVKGYLDLIKITHKQELLLYSKMPIYTIADVATFIFLLFLGFGIILFILSRIYNRRERADTDDYVEVV